ncbi:MAG: hypothetical protein JXA24_07200 [Proteobacteria bacterium]|nr:hypothetical protein [Pseudomonadota bacterium]
MGDAIHTDADGAIALAAKTAAAQVIACARGPGQQRLAATVASLFSGSGGVRLIEAESGRSAMAAAAAAASAGARVMAAASGSELAGAQDLLFWTAAARLPVLLATASAALGIGEGPDSTGAAAQRDAGWITILCGTCQEIVDSTIVACRVAEEAKLPAMLCYDPGSDRPGEISAPGEREVKRFIGQRRAEFAICSDEPRSFYMRLDPDYHAEFQLKLAKAREASARAYSEAARDFSKAFGRNMGATEEHGPREADTIVVAAGTVAGVAGQAIEEIGARGGGARLVKIRLIRPFPTAEIRRIVAEACGGKGVSGLLVVDQAPGGDGGGPLAVEVKSALEGVAGAPPVTAAYAGLGGRAVLPQEIALACSRAREADRGSGPIWIGARE